MSEKLFNSFFQALLVKGYGWIAKLIDLESGFWSIIYQRVYFYYKRKTDRDTLQLIKKIAYPGSLVIDVGANIGFFSLETCRLPDIRVIAFEPEPKNYQNLLTNISNAGYQQLVTSYPIALSNSTGDGYLYMSKLAPTDHKIIPDSADQPLKVDYMRMDDFFVNNQLLFDRTVSLVKIDVQGAEIMVMEGMLRFLGEMSWPVLLVEYTPTYLHNAGVNRNQFLRFFLDLHYRFYDHTLQKILSVESLLQFKDAYMDIVMVHQSSTLMNTFVNCPAESALTSRSN